MKQILLLIVFCFTSCELKMDEFELITIKNNTNRTLNFHVASENSSVIFPDTILPPNSNELSLANITEIVFWGNSPSWEEIIESLPSDTLSIYFFDPDTLAVNQWNDIRNDYKILKRYDLSIEDLQLLNFNVSYPPTENMSEIRQFPIYE